MMRICRKQASIEHIFIAKFLAAIIGTIALLIPATTVGAKESVVALPQKSSMSCDGSLKSVKAYLVKNGYFSLKSTTRRSGEVLKSKIEIDKNRIRNNYYDYPVDRTELVSIHLAGNANKVLGTLMRSPRLMTNLGAQIISACDRVGMVEFSAPWEESLKPVGYFPDRTVRTFSWVESRDEHEIKTSKYPHQKIVVTPKGSISIYKWGYYYSP
jgi:hypothetical protein